ncbi:MAG TPA: DUF1653 domain-containing protein [Verrucomicrobiae bacterium]|nr:DUF1653 domain-containing protein [Verrucomicrobiae bacterium]
MADVLRVLAYSDRVRPYEMFTGHVVIDGVQRPRFERITRNA